MKPIGVRYTDDVSGVLRAIFIGLFLYCHWANTPYFDMILMILRVFLRIKAWSVVMADMPQK